MSMSEFDRQLKDDGFSRLSMQELGLPDDFTEEDIAFIQELDTVFSLDEEETPPYFVQTLLEVENPRFQPVEHKFELKTSARVFRRLKLRRLLFRPSHPFLHVTMNLLPVQRSLVAVMAACLLFMLATMVVTSSSFASGLAFLWSGAHSGVVQVNSYPGGLSSPAHTQSNGNTSIPQPKEMSLSEAQQQLHFSMYWPLSMPAKYNLSAVNLYQRLPQNWADGPIIELNYDYSLPVAHGTGQITICEFKPEGEVFQVVQFGAAHALQIDHDGHAHAIYVNGQWVRINRFSHDWIYGERAELIYERDGVIFWIVGDQRDGVNSDTLLSIASSLQIFNVNRAGHMGGHIHAVTLPTDDSTWLFADDVVYSDGPDGPSLRVIGADSPPMMKNVARFH